MLRKVLVLIDIQREYTTPGRPFYLNGIAGSLERCQKLLMHARENKWDIVHVQHSNGEQAARFNPMTDYFKFVEGFEPQPHEMHIVKNDFSCYSNVEYSNYMTKLMALDEQVNIFMAGYNSVMCCQSTLEEARRLKHKINYISDASLAKSLNGRPEIECHQYQLDLFAAKGLATMVTTEELITGLKSVYSDGITMFNPQLSNTTEAHPILIKKLDHK